MIKKFIKIKGVGRFVSFASRNDDIAFDKTTIIFGYNTYGKSTITSIFRSLRESNAHYIYGRKTFGFSDQQEVEILDVNNDVFVFKSKWQNNNIEIFDNEFILKNVFYGDHINTEQQSSLYEILVGEEIYELRNKISKAKEAQKRLERDRNGIKSDFAIKGLGSFDDFLSLKEDVEIDQKIKETQDEIKQQENLDSLKRLILRTPLKSTFSNFKAELFKTLDLSVEGTVNEHIERNWKDPFAGKDFLSLGLDLLKDGGKCVFCGQDLSGVNDFISNMQKVFSKEYKKIKDSINRYGNQFISLDLEKCFLEFEKFGFELRGRLDYEALLLAKANIDKKIEEKKNDLNLKLDFDNDSDFKDFLEELAKLSELFDNITAQPSNNITKLIALKKLLKQLELAKYRFSVEGVSIFKKYSDAQEKVEEKRAEIGKLNTEHESKVIEVFKNNEKQINYFLKELGANFSLKDFSARSHLGQVLTHFCDFKFVIDGVHVVKISNKTRKDEPEPEDKPHFKNTLSDSDRRILAFAFYLAKLSNDKNLKNKIIVLDDPFSSFDENRKEQTVNLLAALKNNKGDEPVQKIILTHDIGFLCRLFDKFSSGLKALKIQYSSAGGSKLALCDVENDFLKDSYFKDIEYIKNSAESSVDIDEALKKVRICLEHVLKRKYYFLLTPDTLKRKSVGEYLNEIGDGCPIKEDILADNWHEDMHDAHKIMQLNEPAKIAKLKRFLELIREI